MSYMDNEKILDEGFFDKIKKTFTKHKKTNQKFKSKAEEKKYKEALVAAEDALDYAEKLRKSYGIPPIKY